MKVRDINRLVDGTNRHLVIRNVWGTGILIAIRIVGKRFKYLDKGVVKMIDSAVVSNKRTVNASYSVKSLGKVMNIAYAWQMLTEFPDVVAR